LHVANCDYDVNTFFWFDGRISNAYDQFMKSEKPIVPRIRLDVYPSEEMRDALDRWRFEQPGVPNRAAAARRLLNEILVEKGCFKLVRKRRTSS
jgi:hypothetical protein